MRHENGYYHLLAYLVIYFFFNGFLLPEGLLYTMVLSPVMLYFLYKHRDRALSPFWLLILLIPVPFQLLHGADPRTYLVSSMIVFSAAIFLFTVPLMLQRFESAIPDLFKTILVINGALTGLALLILPFSSARDWLWYSVPLSAGIESLSRLKMFTYEASYYALIMTPVFLFFLYRVMSGQQKHPLIVTIACILPLALSLSFGVIGALFIALLVTLIFHWRSLPAIYKRICLYSGILGIFALILIILTWWENPVFLRLENIIRGKDTSAMGRLVYSYMFAQELAFGHNWLFGVGPGQIKVLAHDLIINHYQYHGTVAEIVRIPNGMAELLATYGIYGLAVKLILEFYLFVKSRIFSNIFSFTLFTFLFVYQFTGSFLVNVAELGAWALVFSVRFREFDVSQLQTWREMRS